MTDRKDRDARRSAGGALEAGLNDLLGALNAAAADIAERLDAGEASGTRRSVEVNTRFGPMRAEAGLDVRFADPHPQPTPGAPDYARGEDGGSTQDQNEGPVRVVACDLSERDGHWMLTAELPGAAQDHVSLSLEHGRLIIKATGRRRYHAEAPFPTGRDISDVEIRLDAGLLELHMPPHSGAGS